MINKVEEFSSDQKDKEIVPDLKAFNEIWTTSPHTPPIKNLEDAFTAIVDLENHGKIYAKTHIFDEDIKIIPYSESDTIDQTKGLPYTRGDEALAEEFPPGSIGLAIRHKRPQHRLLSRNLDEKELKNEIKLQDRHIQLLVGVEKNGQSGVIYVDNPQDYSRNTFPRPDYPKIFFKFQYPDYIKKNRELRHLFENNIRTMMACFNTVSVFPEEQYNGGDPLAAFDKKTVKEHVRHMIWAIAGDESQQRIAKAWFEDDEHKIYCSELAHLATSAGLLVPLNRFGCRALVDNIVWKHFCEVIHAHNKGEETAIITQNLNKEVQHIKLDIAPTKLYQASYYAPKSLESKEEKKLSFAPMIMTDILDTAFQAYFQREKRGESIAPVQAAIIKKMKGGILEAMAMDKLHPNDKRRQAAEELFNEIIKVVETPHNDYITFRKKLQPLIKQARRLTGPRVTGIKRGKSLFVPPSLFHHVAKGNYHDGLLRLKYVGHGIHCQLLKVESKGPDPRSRLSQSRSKPKSPAN